MKFSKDLAKAKKSKRYSLENKLKSLESNPNCDINSVEYINCKNQLEEIYDDIAEGIKVRSKCQRYEEGEKSTKFFLNLEKAKAIQGTVKNLEINNKETDNPVEINKELERFFKNLFKRKLRKTKHPYNEFLRDILLPTLSQEKKNVYDKEITEQEVILAMKIFSKSKSTGNDGLAKSFMKLFGKN